MSAGLSETESSDASCDGGTEPSAAVDGSQDDMFESSLVPIALVPSKNSTNDTLFDRVEVSAAEGTPEGEQVSGTNKITIDLPSLPEFEHTTSLHLRADPWRKTLTSGGEIGKLDERTTLDTTFGITYRPITNSNPPLYSLPYRPAFVDEGEFEQQMSAEFRVGEEAGLPQTGNSSDADSFKANGNDTTKDESDDFQDAALIEVLDKQPLNYNTQRNYATTTSAAHASGDSATQERGVNTSKPNTDSQVVSAKALKQLMDTYQEGKGCALSKEGPWAPSLLSNVAADSVGGAPRPGFGSASVGNTLTIMGRDVRHSPIMEVEEEANKEEEDSQHGRARKGSQDAHDRERQRKRDKEHCTGTEGEEGQRGTAEGVEGDVETPHTRAVREWKAIEQLRTAENSVPMEKGVGGALRPISIDESSRVVSTTEVLRHFRSQGLGMYKAAIVPVQSQQGGLWLFRRRPILTIAGGDGLRDEVFLLAQVRYTPDDVMHRRLIQTIYRRMTLEKRACPDLGPHWETIGFQGNDPGTDLNRSMGVFSLIQVSSQLRLIKRLTNQNTGSTSIGPSFVRSTARVCRSPLSSFHGRYNGMAVPVCQYRLHQVGALRRGACYTECNRRGTVLEVMHELHQAQFHAFLGLCRKHPATHHAVHLATVRNSIEKDLHSLVKGYRSYLSAEKRRLEAASSVTTRGVGEQRKGKLDFGRSTGFPKRQWAVMGRRQLRYMTTKESDGS